MKKLWLAVVAVALVLAVVGVAGCNGDGGVTVAGGEGELKFSLGNQQEGIWVNGTGTIYAKPDIAVLRLGIEVQRSTLADAQADAQVAMDNVMEALKDQGVKEEDIQTQYFNIQHIQDWDKYYDEREGEPVIIGYRVTNVVSAKIRDVEKAGEVIDAAAEAGGDLTRIDGISFTVDDPSPYYKEAREEAVKYAKEKAEQLATAAGVKLGSPVYITENTYYPSPNYISRDMAVAESAGGVSTPISAGELEITTTVQINYSIAD